MNETVQTRFVNPNFNIKNIDFLNEPTFLSFHLDFKAGNDVEEVEMNEFTNGSPLFNESFNGPWGFFTGRGLTKQLACWQKFKEKLFVINYGNPWFFQDITGLKDMWKGGFNMSNPFRAEKTELKVTTLESLDWSITYLADLYNMFTYDQELMQEILPDNLRWFNCDAYVIEWRNINFNEKYFTSKIKNVLKGKHYNPIDENDSTDINNYIKFRLYQCEFDFSNTVPFDTLSVSKKPDQAKNIFSIKPGRIEIVSNYKLQNETVEDLSETGGYNVNQNFKIGKVNKENVNNEEIQTTNVLKSSTQAPADVKSPENGQDWWDFCWGEEIKTEESVNANMSKEERKAAAAREAEKNKTVAGYEKTLKGREIFHKTFGNREENKGRRIGTLTIAKADYKYASQEGKDIGKYKNDEFRSHYDNSTVRVDYDITKEVLSRTLGRNSLSAPGRYLGESYRFATDQGKRAHSYQTRSDRDNILLSWNANRTRSINEHGFFGKAADDFYEIAGVYDKGRDIVGGVRNFFNMTTKEKLETIGDKILESSALQNLIGDIQYAKGRAEAAIGIFKGVEEYNPTKNPINPKNPGNGLSGILPSASNLDKDPKTANHAGKWEHETGIGKKSGLGTDSFFETGQEHEKGIGKKVEGLNSKSNFEYGYTHEKGIGKSNDMNSSSNFEDGYNHESGIGKSSSKHSSSNFEEGYNHETGIGKQTDQSTESAFNDGWKHEDSIGKKTKYTTDSLFNSKDIL